MNEVAVKKNASKKETLDRLVDALNWAGIERGRAIEYRKLFEESSVEDRRTRDHMFAYNEFMELLEIYELWREHADNFPGIKDRIKGVFSSGPLLREDEQPHNSSNRPRNDAFTILVAGRLIRASASIMAVEGIKARNVADSKQLTEQLRSDIVVYMGEDYVLIECKRPQSKEKIGPRIAEARGQLEGKDGVIVVDCSAALRPAETILEMPTEAEAVQFLNQLLVAEGKPIVDVEFRANIMGVLLYLRAPVHTILKVSPVLSMSGEPITTYTQNTASVLAACENGASPKSSVFKKLANLLTVSIESKPTLDKAWVSIPQKSFKP